MRTISNGTSVKTIGRNTLFHFTLYLKNESLSDWTEETIAELINEINIKCSMDSPLVMLSFEVGLSKEEYLYASKL
mgnify:CR=1 FL=1